VTAADPPFASLTWDGGPDGRLTVLDQTRLPAVEATLELRTPADVVAALRRLAVRGAPLIGVAGAYGVHLGIRGAPADDAGFAARFDAVCAEIAGARPTAVNLRWAVDRMRDAAARVAGAAAKKRAVFDAARALHAADAAACDALGAYGAALVRPGERLLTYCNTGALATAGAGTALAAILAAARLGRVARVYACETRPLLQGARLTMWELLRAGVDAVLVCDNAAGDLFRRGLVDRVFVGADRIAANGDAANKIGTYALAVLAHAHGVPFHVVAPTSTFDLAAPDGAAIPIEERDPDEVLSFAGVRTAPPGARAFSPAFDVAPARLLTSIVTERGVIAPVAEASVRAALAPRA
jgi:methylthioribose-1-phosphate isomerase